MKVLAVVGAGQNSGKTTAVEGLVRELKKRGFRVGTLKQIHESDFSIDKRGKDSWRHAEAGADVVVAASPREMAAIKRIEGSGRFEESLRFVEGQKLDIFIVEGDPGVEVPKIYAARTTPGEGNKALGEGVLCVVSLTPEDVRGVSVPVYHVEKDVGLVVDLIMKNLKD